LTRIFDEPGRLEQTRYSSLEYEYWIIGVETYALGLPLEQVRDGLAYVALASLRVAQLRGTDDAFPLFAVTLDPADPSRAIDGPRQVSQGKDYSLGNSRDNFRGVTAALAAGEFDLAQRIAALALDPPDASYLGPSSEVCTPSDQRVAYAVRHLYADEADAALDLLARLRPSKRDERVADHADVARMVRALALGDAGLFLGGLGDLLAWHRMTATKKWNYNDHDYILCLPGLGLSALAIRRGLIARDRLPEGDEFFPLELIDLGRDRAGLDADRHFANPSIWWLPEDPG